LIADEVPRERVDASPIETVATFRGWRSTLVAVAAVYLATAGAFSYLSPCGTWNNRVFDIPMWPESDPGGYYVASAHELYSSKGQLLYPGHPGLTLQIMLHAIQRALFGMNRAGGSQAAFTDYAAANLGLVFVSSKVLMTALHALSFWLLFYFAVALVRSERAALLAVLGYATSLPVLYYISRISPEPLVTTFFLGTCLSIWRCHGHREPGQSGKPVLWACLAAICAVSGLVTKMHILGPLPLFGFAYVVAGGLGSGVDAKTRWKSRAMVGIAYGAAAAVAFGLYSLLIDWRAFFALWWGNGSSGLREPLGPFRTVLHILTNAASAPGAIPLEQWRPGATKSGMFFLSELPMAMVGLVGWTACWRRPSLRPRMAWCAAYGAFTLLIWLFRSGQTHDFHGFHYLIIVVALASVFFGYASDQLLGGLGSFRSCTRELGAMLLWTLAWHPFAIWGALDSRLQDVRAFARYRPYLDAVARVAPDQGLVVLTEANAISSADMVHGLSTLDGRRSLLVEKFRERFIAVDSRIGPDRIMAMRQRARSIAIVTDVPEAGGALTPAQASPAGNH
jgi:hypothetical protein